MKQNRESTLIAIEGNYLSKDEQYSTKGFRPFDETELRHCK